ncbi:MAG: GDSL-type esterase/lipase family protein [Bacteroidales bacterium]|nr:GDSL-type esterase/lipase family protein [Bacteroidales bacterium]
MKRILFIAAALFSVAASAGNKASEVTTPAADSRVTYIARTAVSEDGSVSFDWSNSTIRVAFRGDFLKMKVSDTRKNWYNVWIDKTPGVEADKVITTFGKDSTVTVAENLGKGNHFITIQKRTEGEQGTTTVHSFTTQGELLRAEPLKERMIEVVGDSYTCGYGSENSVSTDRFSPATENVNKAYEAIIARYFDADLMTIAHSGMGVSRNYNEEHKDAIKGYHMSERYNQTFDENREVTWDASKSDWKPAITIIYLGANDFSVSLQPHKGRFIAKYHKLLREIKANYGEDHPILCCASKSDENLFNYVREAALGSGMKNVHYSAIFPKVDLDDDRELGADMHPNYKAHKKIAHVFIPYVATLAGWELTGRPIE